MLVKRFVSDLKIGDLIEYQDGFLKIEKIEFDKPVVRMKVKQVGTIWDIVDDEIVNSENFSEKWDNWLELVLPWNLEVWVYK